MPARASNLPADRLPAGAGIGLRAPHYREILERGPRIAFLEVHTENFFGEGGPALRWLERFRERHALSFHGVGLSLGSTDALDEGHLSRLARLVERFQPQQVSEHLSWSSALGRHANDLLPLPFTGEAAAHVAGRIARVQDRLRRRIAVENVTAYLRFPCDEMTEWDFVTQVVRRAGCDLLLDVNNIHVNAVNHGYDAKRFVEAIDPDRVAEIHLAGHERIGGRLVDTHAARVAGPVWALYRQVVARIGPRPTLVEWDAAIPPLDVLLDEARIAEAHLRDLSPALA